MESSAASLAIAIGARVKRERQARQWTLDQLAEVSSLSRRAVVNVEQGSANPSVATLLRLSDALGIGLPALVEPPMAGPVRITRAGEGAVLWTGEVGGQGVLVAGTEQPDVVELWDWTLQPGERHESEAHAPGTRELMQVHQGQVTISIGEQDAVLKPGDAITFPGDIAHSYRTDSKKAARFSLAVFEPGVGARPEGHHA